MPRFHIQSDQHLEHRVASLDQTESDAIILAGDLVPAGHPARSKLLQRFFGNAKLRKPAYFVGGNHDHYGAVIEPSAKHTLPADYVAELESYGVTVLHPAEPVDFMGVTLLGGTLWTDFELYGDAATTARAVTKRFSDGRALFPDFDMIRIKHGDAVSRIIPSDMITLHAATKQALRAGIERATKPVVLVTHFLPTGRSVHPKYEVPEWRGGNPYFASNDDNLFGPKVPLAIHGHTHQVFDYAHPSGTRVVCQPRGYHSQECPAYDKHFVVSV